MMVLMLRTILIPLLCIVMLAGCVSTHMKQFIGKDIRYVIVDSGTPVNEFDMGDGRRAYQFYWGGGTMVLPQTTTQQGSVNIIGNTGQFNSTTVTSPGGVFSSQGCLITYFAMQNKETKAWIVEDISYPQRLAC